MELEDIILSEANQGQKNKNHMISLICKIQKSWSQKGWEQNNGYQRLETWGGESGGGAWSAGIYCVEMDGIRSCRTLGEKSKRLISIPSNFPRAMAFFSFYFKIVFWLLSGEWNMKNGEWREICEIIICVIITQGNLL